MSTSSETLAVCVPVQIPSGRSEILCPNNQLFHRSNFPVCDAHEWSRLFHRSRIWWPDTSCSEIGTRRGLILISLAFRSNSIVPSEQIISNSRDTHSDTVQNFLSIGSARRGILDCRHSSDPRVKLVLTWTAEAATDD